MRRRYRYAARRPHGDLAQAFEAAFAATGAAFNATRQRHLDAYSAKQDAPRRGDLQRALVPAVRATPEWAAVSAVALQQAVAEADRLCRLARSTGHWPRPRDGRRGASIHLTRASVAGAFAVTGAGRNATVVVPTVGRLAIHLHRPLPSDPSSMTVGRDPTGWWVSFVVEMPDPAPVVDGAVVGVDVGVAHRASWVRVEADGSSSRGRIANPRHGAPAELRISRLAARRDRLNAGSRRWREADQRLAHERLRLRRRRLDHARKAAAELLDGVRVVCVERLNVRGLLRDGRASRTTLEDAAMAMLLSAIVERAQATGVQVVRVPAAGTSKTCPACGTRRDRSVPLNERRWMCAACSADLDRDWAAAAMMVRLAREQIAPGAGEIENALGRLGLAERKSAGPIR